MSTTFTAMQEPHTRGRALVVFLVALPIALVTFVFLAPDRGADFLLFGALSLLFLALATMFIVNNGSLNAQWCTASGFMTLEASVLFVIIPLAQFAVGDLQVDSYYLREIVYLLVGFSVFWLACWLFKKPVRFEFIPETPSGRSRPLIAASLLFVVGVAAKLALWKLGFLSFGFSAVGGNAAVDPQGASGGGLTALAAVRYVGQGLLMSMLVSGIEVIGKHSRSPVLRLIFFSSSVLSIGFGVVSGAKIDVVRPLFLLALLLGVTRRRLPRLIWLIPIVFVPLQTFVNAYRTNLESGYLGQINTVGGLSSALRKSMDDVLAGRLSATQANRTDFERLTYRLNDLALFHHIMQLPSPDLLNGDETIWMAPIYPFIPRPLWKDKPLFAKGVRLSEAMGIGTFSSTNIPGIADMYVLGGVGGILVGMFLWGVVLQLFMNSIGGGLSEKGTFFYILILFFLTLLEQDMVALIGGAVEGACTLILLAKVIYGGPLFSLSSFRPRAIARLR